MQKKHCQGFVHTSSCTENRCQAGAAAPLNGSQKTTDFWRSLTADFWHKMSQFIALHHFHIFSPRAEKLKENFKLSFPIRKVHVRGPKPPNFTEEAVCPWYPQPLERSCYTGPGSRTYVTAKATVQSVHGSHTSETNHLFRLKNAWHQKDF